MKHDEEDDDGRVRIDKWLWAARFFKTRSLAAQAVTGGKVQVNGVRAKPARELHEGDEVEVRVGEQLFDLVVRKLSDVRRGAPEAQLLYEEKEESRAKRLEAIERRKAFHDPFRDQRGRPTKRDRRMIRRFTED
jgi:ribosome-associated heat shock protein Hsp15